MKKVLTVLALVALTSGCAAMQPAENVKALRAVNKAEVNLAVSEKLKESADRRAECARQRVVHAEGKLTEAKANFEEVYFK